jgi:dUTP pyrophosphatase
MRFNKKHFIISSANAEVMEAYNSHSTYHDGDSGLDLFIPKDIEIEPGQTMLVDMGVQCQSRSFSWCIRKWVKGEFYNYHSYFLFPRSSISKTPLLMRNSIGLIDSAYTGNIKAPLYNTSSETFTLKKGQRYVQLVNADASPIHFKLVDALRHTSRNQAGFGSTGN